MQELTQHQTAVLERLIAQGFRLVAFPLYASAIGVRRESCAALVVPVEGAGLRLLGDACYLIEGNLSVKVERDGRPHFVWKNKAVPATPGLLAELRRFSEDLQRALSSAS